MRRVIFAWLPFWPTERLRRSGARWPEGRPFALTHAGSGGVRLAAVDPMAAREGLTPGLSMADARALVPSLSSAAHDASADAQGLARLARWLGRYGPFVAPAEHGVFLDVSGVAHLFGGEPALLQDVLARLRGLGLTAHAALADTPGAAWALARYGAGAEEEAGCVAPAGAGLAPLLALPAASLRLEPATAEALRAVGLVRVADVARVPRASLARRFGQSVLDRLDQAAGRLAEPIAALAPEPAFTIELRFAEPLTHQAGLEDACGRLAGLLAARLEAHGVGAKRLRLTLYRIDGDVAEITLGAARPLTAAAAIVRLLARRLEAVAERLDLGFGLDAMALAADQVERPARLQQSWPTPGAEGDGGDGEALAALADRLAATLGEDALCRLAPQASHWPERAQVRAPRTSAPAPFAARRDRPPFVLPRPEPIEAVAETPDGPPRRFRWRRVAHRVSRADGPERIAAEWWRSDGPTRDYYTVETVEGRRLWVFREGLYDREPGPQRWFVHGCFP